MALAKLTPPGLKQGMPCSVASILADLDERDPADAKALREMLTAPWRVWSHTAIEKALRDEGHPIGVGTIGKHRRGHCRCKGAA